MPSLNIEPKHYSFSIIKTNEFDGRRPSKQVLKDHNDRIAGVYADLKAKKKEVYASMPDSLGDTSREFVVQAIIYGIRQELAFEEACKLFLDAIEPSDFDRLKGLYDEFVRGIPETTVKLNLFRASSKFLAKFAKSYKSRTFVYLKQKITNEVAARYEVEALLEELEQDKIGNLSDEQVIRRPLFRKFLQTLYACKLEDALYASNAPNPLFVEEVDAIGDFLKEWEKLESGYDPRKAHEAWENSKNYGGQLADRIAIAFTSVIDNINAKINLDFDMTLIKEAMREQKRHSFVRFTCLPFIYFSFVNTVHAISNFQPAFKGALFHHIKDLIEGEKDNGNNNGNEYEEKCDYRQKGFMDLRKKGSEELKEYTQSLSRAMRTAPDHPFYTSDLVRAHALPCPGAFSWEDPRVLKCGSANAEEIPVIDISKDLFLEFKSGQISQEELESRVISLLNSKANELQDQDQLFIYCIAWIKKFYLHLLSETELLPIWINEKLDHISEWSGDNATDYKSILKRVLTSLLNAGKDRRISFEEVEDLMNQEYVTKVFDKLGKSLKGNKGVTPADKVMQVGLAQIHQAILYSLMPEDSFAGLLNSYA